MSRAKAWALCTSGRVRLQAPPTSGHWRMYENVQLYEFLRLSSIEPFFSRVIQLEGSNAAPSIVGGGGGGSASGS